MTPTPPQQSALGAVIVTHRQAQEADALATQLTRARVPTVVVETGDESAVGISNSYGFKAVRNIGYGSAINLGVAALLSPPHHGPPHILLILNADCRIDESSIERLRRAAVEIQGRVGAFAIRQTDESGLATEWVRAFPSAEMYLRTALRGRRAVRSYGPDDIYPSGAAIAVTTEAFTTLGGFDPAFFLYFEESDLYRRLTAAGFEIHGVDGVEVRHTGAGATSRYAAWTATEFGRSAAIYGRKHASSFGAYSLSFVTYLASLIATKSIQRQPESVRTALWHLAGFALGVALPTYEPLVHSPLHSEPQAKRHAASAELAAAVSETAGRE